MSFEQHQSFRTARQRRQGASGALDAAYISPATQPVVPYETAGAQRVGLCLRAIRQSAMPLILQVTHGMGGGVERHVRELHALAQGRAWVLILRPGPGMGVVRLALDASPVADQLDFKLPQDSALLRRTLLAAGLARIHVHHVIGFPEPLWPLLQGLRRPVDLTLHDYTIIAGSPTLTNRKGTYAGWRSNGRYEYSNLVHSNRLRVLAVHAQRCLVPSLDMQHRLSLALPWLRTQVRAHPDRECFGPYPAPRPPCIGPGQSLRVLCLGALGREKGVEVLRSVAALARRRGLPVELSLLGSAHVPLGAAVTQLGPYSDEQLPALLASEQPHLLWFPVRCPETWSYTLSAALEAGIPVLASDLGAFAERLQGRPWSWLQAYHCSADAWLSTMLQIREQCVAARAHVEQQAQGWPQQQVPAFYGGEYLVGENRRCVMGALPSSHYWHKRLVSHACLAKAAGWRSRLIAFALRIREWPLVGRLLAWVPYNFQRSVKRMLSRGPMR